MTFSTTTLSASLADYLASVLPGVQMLQDPAQQGLTTPCMFLQTRYSYTERKRSARDYYLRRIGFDLTYLEDYNLPNLQQRYEAAAEALDPVMETIEYSDGTESTLLRTYEREYNIDLDALHYKFELHVWVRIPHDEVKMQTMDYNEEVILPE